MKVVFVIPPQAHLLDITGPAHIFYEAVCYGAPAELLYSCISTEPANVVSSSGLAFHQLIPFGKLLLEAGDLVFVPGLDASLLLSDAFYHSINAFLQWLQVQRQAGVVVCAVCTGAFLLGEAGLLNHCDCTTHWKYAAIFQQRYPTARFRGNRLFTKDGGVYTSAGVASGIDLALFITEQLWGPFLAAQVAKEVVVYFRRGPDDVQLNIFTQYRNHLDVRVHQVQDVLMQRLDEAFSIELLAGEVNMSSRNLTRLFKKTVGITIGAYHARLRVARATQLLKEGATMQTAAIQCGFKSVNSLRTLLNNAC